MSPCTLGPRRQVGWCMWQREGSGQWGMAGSFCGRWAQLWDGLGHAPGQHLPSEIHLAVPRTAFLSESLTCSQTINGLSGLCSLPELWQDFLGHLIRGLLWRIREEHVILKAPHFRWRAEEEKKAYSHIDHLAQGFHGLFLCYMLWQNYSVPIHYPFTHSALVIKSLSFSCAPCTQEPVSHFPLQLVLAN